MSEVTSRPDDRFTQNYEAYGTMLYRISLLTLGNTADAEEAVQETFVKLLYQAPAFRDPEHEKAWLIRVITNHCRSQRRGIWHSRVQRMENLEEWLPAVRQPDRPILEQVMLLHRRYRIVLYLHYYEDYSVKEIADLLDIGESAVKMRLKRGRELLRLELEEKEA
ncbi:RNA polymerase sigma factor [Gorillibacterium sp. CAU 1737]|uniref:RNA polymerase sigma factor n=1 Tax=Gorillibacterium sp. CAU 1737 TaxID=3140362 RepID=UPI003261722F